MLAPRIEAHHLLLVVLIHKGLHRLDSGEDCLSTKERRQGAGQPAHHPPNWQQACTVSCGHPMLHQLKVLLLRRQVTLCELTRAGISRDRQDTAVDHHRTHFTCVIRPQLLLEPSRQAGKCGHLLCRTVALSGMQWRGTLLHSQCVRQLAVGRRLNVARGGGIRVGCDRVHDGAYSATSKKSEVTLAKLPLKIRSGYSFLSDCSAL